MTINTVINYLKNLQNNICHALEQEDGKAKFITDSWEHKSGGGGITKVISNGNIIEKGGVNFSHVRGKNLPPSATKKRPELAGCEFEATGISLVIHPNNPFVPTSHMNIRFFSSNTTDNKTIWWFGGGFDLTPYYGFEEDCIHWHQTAKSACDAFGENIYSEYKKQCDNYFYIKHRNEARGIGGLFFDDINLENNNWNFEKCFDFIKSVGNSYIPAYLPIIQKRKNNKFTEQHKKFQKYRRGRYVEFNLVYDRGTLFGLQSNGRTESILMSLPPEVEWHYDYQIKPNSPEAELTKYFLPTRDWLA